MNTKKIALSFSNYIGQKVLVTNEKYTNGQYSGTLEGIQPASLTELFVSHVSGSDGWEAIADCKLVLKPLSEITDEDAVSVAKIVYPNIETDELTTTQAEVGRDILQSGFSEINFSRACLVAQFLQWSGYDLPQQLLGGKTIHESGFAIYNTETNKVM